MKKRNSKIKSDKHRALELKKDKKELCGICGKPAYYHYIFEKLNRTIHRCKEHEHNGLV